MVQAIVLDFDGVVVNSEPLHLRAFQEVLAVEGQALSAQEYYNVYVGLDDVGMFRAFAEHRGLPSDAPWVRQMVTSKAVRMQALLAEGSPLFAGAADRIRELAAVVPVAIASGALRHEILQVLDGAGLTSAFSVIVAAGETPRGKPAPDPYARAVDLLGREMARAMNPSQVVAVEDTIQGLASARDAGLRTVAVTTTYPPETLAEADAVVSSLREVSMELLERVVRQGNGGA
jgi:beta-phosphoglucomutase-like phosphatase (HAD superfamily)